MPGLNLGPLTSNYTVTPYTPAAGSFTNPYFAGGVGQAGSNANLNAEQAGGEATAAGGLAATGAATGQQTGLAAQLAAVANGSAPSVAQSQLAQNTSSNIGTEMALAAQARGGNPATSAYNAAAGAGAINEAAAGQAATAGIAEREAAAGTAGQLFQGAANTGLGVAQLGQQGSEFATGTSTAQQQALLQASENQQSLEGQQSLGAQQINAGTSQQNAGIAQKLIGGIASGVGSGAIAAFKEGGVVPGPDSGQDDKLIAARGQELVISPSDPSYSAIKQHLMARDAAKHAAPRSRASRVVQHMGA